MGPPDRVRQLVQAGIGAADLYALTLTVPPLHRMLKTVLSLETLVQCIQFGFYLWLVSHFHLPSLARHRYLDWLVTTPVMLLSVMIYLEYEQHKTRETLDQDQASATLTAFVRTHATTLLVVLGANFAMLLFGYLGEIDALSKTTVLVCGTGALLMAFGTMQRKFALHSSKLGKTVFAITAVVWLLYGVAFMLPTVPKNLAYNALDIVAKNFFGAFLFTQVWKMRRRRSA